MKLELITDPALSGRENMRRDNELIECGGNCLRFYTWSPACVSFGYFQQPERDLNLDYCRSHGIDIVKRPTGGRAVLHDRELTYALAVDENALPAGVIPSYHAVASVFITALREWGLEAVGSGSAARAGRGAVCFATPSAHEITVGGKKLIGSAQVRRAGRILQHGSILLQVDVVKHAAVMNAPDTSRLAAQLAGHMTGLEELLGRTISQADLISLITRHFQTGLGFSF